MWLLGSFKGSLGRCYVIAGALYMIARALLCGCWGVLRDR